MARWIIDTDQHIHWWNRSFLGLTFFERRLREGKIANVDSLVFTSISPDTLQFTLRKPSACAPFSIQKSPPITAQDVHVPLYSLVTSGPSPKSWFSFARDEDWDEGVKKFKSKIISESGAGWIAKKLNKPVSFAFSVPLSETFITPNLWSLLNLVVGLMSAWFVSQPDRLSVAIGGILFQLASIFDGVDGEIAKFRVEFSKAGAWIDSAVDNLSLLAFLTGVGIHLSQQSYFQADILSFLFVTALSLVLLFFGIIFHFVSTRCNSGSLVSYDKMFVNHLPKSDWVVEWSRKARYLVKKDFFSFLFGVICLTGFLDAILLLVVIGAGSLLFAVLYLNLRYGQTYDPRAMRTSKG